MYEKMGSLPKTFDITIEIFQYYMSIIEKEKVLKRKSKHFNSRLSLYSLKRTLNINSYIDLSPNMLTETLFPRELSVPTDHVMGTFSLT